MLIKNDVTLIRLRSPGPSNRGEVCPSDVVPWQDVNIHFRGSCAWQLRLAGSVIRWPFCHNCGLSTEWLSGREIEGWSLYVTREAL